MEELIERIGRCKAAIDHGFSRVGPTLSVERPLEEALLRSANRMIRLSNAAVLLCKSGHANESTDLFPSLVGTACSMLWIALPANRKKAPGDAAAELKDFDWSRLHLSSDEKNAFKKAGLADVELDSVSRDLHEYIDQSKLMNNASIPWAHVFGKAGPGVEPECALSLVARAMNQAIRALDSYWPGMFPAPEEER